MILKTKDSPLPGEGTGIYIMQQRSLKAKYYAGMWDATGGSVKAGETPRRRTKKARNKALSRGKILGKL